MKDKKSYDVMFKGWLQNLSVLVSFAEIFLISLTVKVFPVLANNGRFYCWIVLEVSIL